MLHLKNNVTLQNYATKNGCILKKQSKTVAFYITIKSVTSGQIIYCVTVIGSR